MSENNNDFVTNNEEDSTESQPRGYSHDKQLTPGEMLKRAREEKDIAISTIGKNLKLDTNTIKALENDEYKVIGAPVFVKGHLRKYAEFVGVPSDDIMLAYYQIARTKEATPIITQTQPLTDARPKLAWVGKLLMGLVVLALLASLAYAIYRGAKSYLSDAEASLPASEILNTEESQELPVPNLPASSAADNNIGQTNTVPLPVLDDAENLSVQTDVGQVDEPQENLNDEAQIEAQVAETENVDQSDEGQSQVAVATSSDSNAADVLNFSFTDECWVLVTDENGKRLYMALGKKGMSSNVNITGNTEITLGNVYGVNLTLNNESYDVPQNVISGKRAKFVLVPNS